MNLPFGLKDAILVYNTEREASEGTHAIYYKITRV